MSSHFPLYSHYIYFTALFVSCKYISENLEKFTRTVIYSELNKESNTIGQEGCVTQYQTGHAEGAEDELPYVRHQESATRDPRWLHR